MKSDIDVWRRFCREVNGALDSGPLAVRVVRDVVRALGLDPEHAKVADIAPAVEALRARVAELEAAARWVPVGERLPDEGATVLVHSIPHGVMVATYQMDLVKPAFFGHGYAPGPVTHWRPMPAGPEVQP